MGPRGGTLVQPGWVVWEGFLEEEGIPEVSPKQRREGDILSKHTYNHNNLKDNFE